MPDIDVWSHGSSPVLRELLASALSALVLQGKDSRHVYFSSPWMSNFMLLKNSFGEFAALFPSQGEQAEISFVDYLVALSRLRPVRIITVHNSTSDIFVEALRQGDASDIDYRIARTTYHEKGILSPNFYFEGSMNLTHSGVHIREEKVTFHTEREGSEKINRAFLEFDRRWKNLT